MLGKYTKEGGWLPDSTVYLLQSSQEHRELIFQTAPGCQVYSPQADAHLLPRASGGSLTFLWLVSVPANSSGPRAIFNL